MKNNNLMMTLIVAAVVGGITFFGGMKYQESLQAKRADLSGMRIRQTGNMPAGLNQRTGAGMIRGEIINKDDESITVKMADNSSKIIMITDNTEINKATKAETEELVNGQQVMIFGSTNADGSLTASQIQLNFDMFRGQQEQPFTP